MLFSVLIPVYNNQKYLKKCLDSVINQSFSDFEIIIIDDGSTDGSDKICDEYLAKYSQKIIVMHKPKNAGLLLARRDAIALAKGEYCISVDSDDYIEPDTLQCLSKLIDEVHPDIIQYDLYVFDEDSTKSRNYNGNKKLYVSGQFCTDMSILRNAIIERTNICWSMCSKCVKKTILNSDFNYYEYAELKYGEDTLQSLDIYSKAKNFVYLDKKMYNYRMGSGMTSVLPEKFYLDFFRIVDVARKFYNDWKLIDLSYKLDYFIIDTIYYYLLNVSYTSKSISEILYKVKNLYLQKHFQESYRNLKSSRYYRIRTYYKVKIIICFLYYRLFFLLSFMLFIRVRFKNL